MPVFLLILFSVALCVGTGIVVMVIRRGRIRGNAPRPPLPAAPLFPGEPACIFHRPACWLAVKTRSGLAVQCALGLYNVKPCSWTDGLMGEEKVFIAPPVRGWILVMGSGLPDPSDDIDACFRFITGLSRRLGQVQFFVASRIVHHHAWIRADNGRIVRAYAWAGKTLWQQGAITSAERELGLRTFGYTDTPERASFGQPDFPAVNAEKVPFLAARWSLDPARIDTQSLLTESGVAGEPSRRY